MGEASCLDQGLEKDQTPNALLQHLLPPLSSRSLTQICPKQETKTGVTVFSCESLKGFVSSTANVVLLRIMAWQRSVPSGAHFLALDSEGKLCYCTYVSTVKLLPVCPGGKLEGSRKATEVGKTDMKPERWMGVSHDGRLKHPRATASKN